MKPVLLSISSATETYPRMPIGNVLSVDRVRPPEPRKRSPLMAAALMTAMSAPFMVGQYCESDRRKLARYPEGSDVAEELKRKAQ